MFEEWKFRREIRRMQEAKESTSYKFVKLYRDALRDEGDSAAASIESEARMEDQSHQASINHYTTAYLSKMATSLLVPMPPIENDNKTYWMKNPIYDDYVLTPNGVKHVRDDLHEEIKKRWEMRFIWVNPLSSLLSFLIALGGVAAACLSVWYKH